MRNNYIFALGLLLVLAALLSHPAGAQDYFSDLKAGGTPILLKNIDDHTLFMATGNVGDNSIKANLYKQYWINSTSYNAAALTRQKSFIGWGLSGKAKTENGVGSLFGSAQLNPGFSGGTYLSYSRHEWHSDAGATVYGNWALILSGNFSTAAYQFYHADSAFAKQLSKTNFNGNLLGLSFVKGIFKGANDLFLGASVSVGSTSNYADLDLVTVKNDSIFTNGAGSTRTVTATSNSGDTYAVGNYREYTNINARINASLIPGALHNMIAFILYPSVDFSKAFSPKYNVGLSMAYLKKGSPSTSQGAVYFELNDMGNAAAKKGTFLKRSFKVGVSTSLNVFTSGR